MGGQFTVRAIFVISLTLVSAKLVRIECPNRCKCDKYEGLKRVQCINKNLLNIADIPISVEILDVSYNQISELKDHEFIDMGLSSLKLLNLSHNKIGHMQMHTFQNLDSIKTIDLSYNVIQYIFSEWFYDVTTIKELYLNNNDFAVLPSVLIESKSLEVLDISNCRISHIKEDTFSKLPNLQILNLEANYLIELNVNSLKYLQNLRSINLMSNPLSCSNNVKTELTKYLLANDVRFKDPCKKAKRNKVEKFQKMIDAREPTVQKNLWIYDEETKGIFNRTTIDCNCVNNVTRDDQMLEIIKMSPILSVAVTFVVGLVLGLIIACNVEIKSSDVKSRPERNARYSIIRSRVQLSEHDFPLVTNCENIYESTPVPQRRIEFHQL